MQAAEPIVRKRLTQAELDVICARHDRLFQARPGGARAVFAWMDISGLSLRGRNLADADFAAACLENCDLTGARLDNANFFGADMQEAVLVNASLRRTDLRHCQPPSHSAACGDSLALPVPSCRRAQWIAGFSTRCQERCAMASVTRLTTPQITTKRVMSLTPR